MGATRSDGCCPAAARGWGQRADRPPSLRGCVPGGLAGRGKHVGTEVRGRAARRPAPLPWKGRRGQAAGPAGEGGRQGLARGGPRARRADLPTLRLSVPSGSRLSAVPMTVCLIPTCFLEPGLRGGSVTRLSHVLAPQGSCASLGGWWQPQHGPAEDGGPRQGPVVARHSCPQQALSCSSRASPGSLGLQRPWGGHRAPQAPATLGL